MIDTVETILVRIDNEEIKFRIPLEIVPLSFKPVTKHSNLGIDVEYIVKNDYLGIEVKASSEERGRKDFREEFRKLCYWCMLDDEIDLSIHKNIQKRRLESFIDK